MWVARQLVPLWDSELEMCSGDQLRHGWDVGNVSSPTEMLAERGGR